MSAKSWYEKNFEGQAEAAKPNSAQKPMPISGELAKISGKLAAISNRLATDPPCNNYRLAELAELAAFRDIEKSHAESERAIKVGPANCPQSRRRWAPVQGHPELVSCSACQRFRCTMLSTDAGVTA